MSTVSTIAVKKVDEQIYRRARAIASLKGKTVGEAVNEALRLWVELSDKSVLAEDLTILEEERLRNNAMYEKIESELIAKHLHEYAVVAEGRLIGTFKTRKLAYLAVKKTRPKQAIVTQIQRKSHPRIVQLE
ncbi:MAG: hypothetical protein JRN52_15170 [Nitrososphaerota archaeon]|nr:hypothetical protein [Nitrososphaerota archaeon]